MKRFDMRIVAVLIFICGAVLPFVLPSFWAVLAAFLPGTSIFSILIMIVSVYIYDTVRRPKVKSGGKEQWLDANISSYHEMITRLETIKSRSGDPKSFFGGYIRLPIIIFTIFGALFVPFIQESDYFFVYVYIVFGVYSFIFLLVYRKKVLPYSNDILLKEDNYIAIIKYAYPSCFRIIPQFQMHTLDNGQEAPVDVRFALDYQYKTEEWVSLHFFTTLNAIPNPAFHARVTPFKDSKISYPFTYMVFVAKEQGPLFQALSNIPELLERGWKIEQNTAAQYPTIAITYQSDYTTAYPEEKDLIGMVCETIQKTQPSAPFHNDDAAYSKSEHDFSSQIV